MKDYFLFTFFLLFIIFFNIDTISSQEKIITSGDNWSYYDNGPLDNNWYKNEETYSNWKKGKTPIGYGDNKVITEISFGDSEDKKDIVKYFVKYFTIMNPEEYSGFEFDFKRDDGIIVYLNGKEIYKNNLPIGPIFNNTKALKRIDSKDEKKIIKKIISSQKFKEGINILKVSIHQYNLKSSDCIFDLELIGHKDYATISNIIIDENLNNIKLNNEINDLNNKFQIERIAVQQDLLKSSRDNYKYLLLLISFLLVIVIIISFLMYQNFKNKNNGLKNKIIELKNTILKKEQKLISASTQLLHSRQYFKEIKADIRGIKTEDKALLKSINNQINLILDNNEDWKNLQEHFNMVYSGFYDALNKQHPSLSETELRHCMFIKLHLQTKEIAKILLIDPRSVQTSRYRIKKKMNLNENYDLRDYLLHLKY
ncbi:MAG: helix-turn-helix transcriptional regulator [Polaribacter sp.]